MTRLRQYALHSAVALTALTAFLLPLKFGGISGLAEAPSFFPPEALDWLIVSSWPTEIFSIVTGAALLLTAAGGALRLPASRPTRRMVYLWGAALPLAVLPGFVNTAVRDYAFAMLTHCLGTAAWCWTTALLLADAPRRRRIFVGALMCGFMLAVLSGWRLYFWGFEETRRYYAERAAAGAVEVGEQLQIKLDDDRVYATFASCNAFAGCLILVGAAFAFAARKVGGNFEPKRLSRWLFFLAAAVPTLAILPLTRSRGALLCALLAALGAFLASRLPRSVKAAGLAVFLAAGIGGAWYVQRAGRGFSSGLERLDYLATSGQLIAAHPVCGAGWDGFFREHMRVKRTSTDEAAHDPHNFVVSFAAQSGVLPGIVALLALALPLWELFRRYRSFGAWRRAVCWGCAAGALHQLMEVDHQIPALPAAFWLLALAALTDGAPDDAPPMPAAKRRYPVAAAAALTGAAALAFGLFILRGDLAFSRFAALIRPEPGEVWTPPAEHSVELALERVRRSRLRLPFALECLAEYRVFRGEPAEAEKLLFKSLELGGPRPGPCRLLAEIAERSGDRDGAGVWQREAHRLFPAKYPPAPAPRSGR